MLLRSGVLGPAKTAAFTPGRLILRGVVVAAALIRSPDVLALPQAMLVRYASITLGSSAGPGGEIRAKLTIDDTTGGGTFAAALLAGAISAEVTVAGQLRVLRPITGCQRQGGRLRCRSADGVIRLSLKTSAARPFLYDARLRISRAEGVSGTEMLRSPVRFALRRAGAGDLVDVISDCTLFATGRLLCVDRGRPNIVFIVSDDQRWDTVSYMPRVLDRLAARGVSFTNAFVTTPSCASSRASMLTGQYAHNHGVLQIAAPYGGATVFVGPDASTLATWLHDEGYRTGMYGKYLTDYARQCPPFTAACYVPPGWDEWHVFSNKQAYYNYQLAENGQINSFGAAESDYSTDVIAAKAVDFILTAEGQPFFLHVGFHAPHQEGALLPLPAPRHLGLRTGIEPWRPVSYDEEDISDKPSWFVSLPRASTLLAGSVPFGTWGDAVRVRQLESLAAVDEAIDAILEALEATGQEDNTIIVFTSDNGHFHGEHRFFFGKGAPYEESVRVPLIIRYPRRITAPRSEARLALNIDLAPTLAALADVHVPDFVDGRSLAPLLLDAPASWRQDFVIEAWFPNARPGKLPTYSAVRGERWKYVSYPSTGDVELYDLASDPYELDNRARDPAYASIVSALKLRLEELSHASGGGG